MVSFLGSVQNIYPDDTTDAGPLQEAAPQFFFDSAAYAEDLDTGSFHLSTSGGDNEDGMMDALQEPEEDFMAQMSKSFNVGGERGGGLAAFSEFLGFSNNTLNSSNGSFANEDDDDNSQPGLRGSDTSSVASSSVEKPEANPDVAMGKGMIQQGAVALGVSHVAGLLMNRMKRTMEKQEEDTNEDDAGALVRNTMQNQSSGLEKMQGSRHLIAQQAAKDPVGAGTVQYVLDCYCCI